MARKENKMARKPYSDNWAKLLRGKQAWVSDVLLVNEAAGTLVRDGTHRKLAHEHRTGSWRATAFERPCISYTKTR